MAKKESTFFNMTLTLLIITGIASFSLGGIYNLTKEPIAQAKKKRLREAISIVVSEFDSIKEHKVKPADAKDSLTIFVASKDDKIVGTAVKTYTDKGFSGRFWLMVGFNPDGSIYNTSVLEHLETPGLGDKMDASKSDFPVQFKGKNPSDFKLAVKKDGGDVDAITAATISSRAFCDAVQKAYIAFGETNTQTEVTIQQLYNEKQDKAIKEALPEFDNLGNMYIVDELEFYPAKKRKNPVGTAVKTYSKNGYNGEIWLIVGFLPDGTIHNITYLEHKETPNIESETAGAEFKNQFKGKNLSDFKLAVKKDGGDVDAISEATTSSQAICEAVQRAFDAFQKGGKK